ncbi:hypothetical protein M1N89_02600, partial [Dehalococcoidia bacterium]|nr:hypothetical protein [Dehalococcoidia bacterium]
MNEGGGRALVVLRRVFRDGRLEQQMKISVMADILEANDRIAAANKEVFGKHRNLVINLMSS